MKKAKKLSKLKMRVVHRYLGFFLAGIMAVYSISGIVLIFRDTDTFKIERQNEKTLEPNIKTKDLGKQLRIKDFKIDKEEGELLFFKNGVFNKKTGLTKYTTMELPYVLEKMTRLHKAKSDQPLYWLNIFFGLSLLFFVISTFWMFLPKTKIFRNGLYFTLGGIILTMILLFV